MKLIEFYSEEKSCSYIASKTSRFRYFHIQNVSAEFYGGLLERGWRRFGNYFFTPMCEGCTDCISIRTLIDEFKFSRNHRRVLKNAQNIDMYVQKPSVSQAHIELYNRYHWRMREKKGWEYNPITPESYADMFVEGHQNFGYEFLYFIGSELVGVGLVDVLKDSITAVYFYYNHDFAHYSLGTLNILKQIQIAKEYQLKYFYPGYWIKGHYCMGYKERFAPFESLQNIPDIFDIPLWKLYEKDKRESQ